MIIARSVVKNIAEDNQAYLIDVKKNKQQLKKVKKEDCLYLLERKMVKRFMSLQLEEKVFGMHLGLCSHGCKIWLFKGLILIIKEKQPGLGANIKQRFFMDDFIGEHLMKMEILKELQLLKEQRSKERR